MKHELTIVYEKGENGWWIATALEIPGGFSQGKTLDEARENVLDAIRELMLSNREQVETEIQGKEGVVREQVVLELT